MKKDQTSDGVGIESLTTSLSLIASLGREPLDSNAWSNFVHRYGPCILAWSQKLGLQPSDAEDVTQTVLSRLWTRRQVFRYDPNRSFRAYLKTLTRYAWCDLVAARQKRLEVPLCQMIDPVAELAACDDLTTRLTREYDLEIVAGALEVIRQRVHAKTWQAFQALELQGRPVKQVAAELSISVASAYKARSNVRRMLRETIQLANLEGAE